VRLSICYTVGFKLPGAFSTQVQNTGLRLLGRSGRTCLLIFPLSLKGIKGLRHSKGRKRVFQGYEEFKQAEMNMAIVSGDDSGDYSGETYIHQGHKEGDVARQARGWRMKALETREGHLVLIPESRDS
jgi:hypothetical protein